LLDYTHLEALLAVQKEGSFEAAAKTLGMSPIGVASRIRKLEERMGLPLLRRKPTCPTEAGSVLCDYAEKVVSLETEFIAKHKSNALQPADQDQTLKIAVNNESQLDWFSDAYGMERRDGQDPWALNVILVDQDHTVEHMRNGDVVAALSSQSKPIHGYKSYHLGTIDHLAVATPGYIAEHMPEGVTLERLAATACIRRSDDDELCYQWMLKCFDATVALTSFRMPELNNQVDLCVTGNGWAVLPEHVVRDPYQSGALVELLPDTIITKPLYWHVAGIMVDELSPITKSIRESFLV